MRRMRRGAAQLIVMTGVSGVLTLSACGLSFAGVAPPLPQNEAVQWVVIIFSVIMAGLGLLTALHKLFFMPWLKATTAELKLAQTQQEAAHRALIESTLRDIGEGFGDLMDRHRDEAEPHPAISAQEKKILERLDSASQKLSDLVAAKEKAERDRLMWEAGQ